MWATVPVQTGETPIWQEMEGKKGRQFSNVDMSQSLIRETLNGTAPHWGKGVD